MAYEKKSLWKWILIYVVIAAVAYGLIYYFLVAKNGTYVSQNQNNNSQTTLDLSNQSLNSIPSSVFNQTNLQELNISHNSLIGAIPSQIGQLKNLKTLDASYNQMTGVPSEIGQLQNLQTLDLSYNKITGLPNELANLKNLKNLNLAGNQYSEQDLAPIRAALPNTTFILK